MQKNSRYHQFLFCESSDIVKYFLKNNLLLLFFVSTKKSQKTKDIVSLTLLENRHIDKWLLETVKTFSQHGKFYLDGVERFLRELSWMLFALVHHELLESNSALDSFRNPNCKLRRLLCSRNIDIIL